MEKVGIFEIIAAVIILLLALWKPLYSAIAAIVLLFIFGAVNLSMIFEEK